MVVLPMVNYFQFGQKPILYGNGVIELMKKGTAPKIAKIASRVLDNPASSKPAKIVAASALTQTQNPSEKTSARVATVASKILQDDRFSKDAKTLAASVLAQKEK
jgi:hypothetical protein